MARLFPVVVVGGARQTGKSTMLGQLDGIRQTFVFDPAQDVGGARTDPELFLRLHEPPLILDEVQYAPELLGALKRLVDTRRDRAGQYFLTGSQQFGVLSGVRETLAGRAGLLDLHPMTRRELDGGSRDGLLAALLDADPDDDASLVDAVRARRSPAPARSLLERLYRGGFPGLGAFPTEDVPLWFDAYFRTYVERDARRIRSFDDPHEFARFVGLVAALTAQELNVAQLGREIGIANRTARGWLDTLEQSYQALLLPAWSGNATKRVSGRPKVHLWDSGLASHLQAISTPASLGRHPSLGALFETYAVTELAKQAASLAPRPRLHHWRTAGGAEIDLLIERDGVFHPIEVKLASQLDGRAARGLRAFRETHPDLRVGTGIIVYAGDSLRLVAEHAIAVPVDAL